MNEKLLRRVLSFDAWASAVSVLLTIGGASLLGRWLQVSAWIPLAVGVALIPWVAFLVRTIRHQPLRRADVLVVVIGNLGWAVAAAILIVGFPDALSPTGKWIVGVFSLAVLDLGIVEWVGLRRPTPNPQLAPPVG